MRATLGLRSDVSSRTLLCTELWRVGAPAIRCVSDGDATVPSSAPYGACTTNGFAASETATPTAGWCLIIAAVVSVSLETRMSAPGVAAASDARATDTTRTYKTKLWFLKLIQRELIIRLFSLDFD